jgi:hypothetical protein
MIHGELPYVPVMDLLFAPVGCLEYIDESNVDLPIEINPDEFISWLGEIGEEVYLDNYGMTVCSMCEYSVAWVSKLLEVSNVPVSRLKICEGSFGYGDHFWFILDDKYFVDLTLAQFKSDAPRLAIIDKDKAISPTTYKNYTISTYKNYIKKFI